MEDATPARKKPSSVRARARAQTPAARRARTATAATAIRRLPLASLRVFVAVGDHLSFSRAADALGVTSGAASMQIRALEDYLRVPLFRRNGRHVALTRDGSVLLAKVKRGLADLQQALDETRKDRASGPLRLTTFASFLSQWLLPRLGRFTVRHPQLELEMHTSDEVVDFVQRDFQVAIRMGKGNWPGLHVEKLFEEWLVPVCRPDLLARLGPVHDADDLRRYRLLNSRWGPWTAWLYDNAEAAMRPTSGMIVDDGVATLQACESGQLLALGPWCMAARAIEEGRLAIASPRAVQMGESYYFVCPPNALQMEKVMAFRDWLIDEALKFAAAVPFGGGAGAR